MYLYTGTHLGVALEEWRAEDELRKDAAYGPHVHLRPVQLGPQQQLRSAVELSHHLKEIV